MAIQLPSQHGKTHGDFEPHRAVGFGRDVPVGKEILEAAAQDFREGRRTCRVADGVRRRSLGWYKIIHIRLQSDITASVPDVTGASMIVLSRVRRALAERHRLPEGEGDLSTRRRQRRNLMLARKSQGRSREFGSPRPEYACLFSEASEVTKMLLAGSATWTDRLYENR